MLISHFIPYWLYTLVSSLIKKTKQNIKTSFSLYVNVWQLKHLGSHDVFIYMQHKQEEERTLIRNAFVTHLQPPTLSLTLQTTINGQVERLSVIYWVVIIH